MHGAPLSPEAHSCLLKLQNGKDLVPSQAAKRLLELGFSKQRLAELMLEAIQRMQFFHNEVLVEVVCGTTSKALYLAIKSQLFSDRQALLELHQWGYSDPAIEIHLCEILYGLTTNDVEPYRRLIAESLKNHGTQASLQTLNAILF